MKTSKIFLATALATSVVVVPAVNIQSTNIAKAATEAEYEAVYKETINSIDKVYPAAVAQWKSLIENTLKDPNFVIGGRGPADRPLFNLVDASYINKLAELDNGGVSTQQDKYSQKIQEYIMNQDEKAEKQARKELGVVWNEEKMIYEKVQTGSNANSSTQSGVTNSSRNTTNTNQVGKSGVDSKTGSNANSFTQSGATNSSRNATNTNQVEKSGVNSKTGSQMKKTLPKTSAVK